MEKKIESFDPYCKKLDLVVVSNKQKLELSCQLEIWVNC